ncbi:hypothetical protein P7C71_g1031, partial [Lecanoromycetidae sp. Uapishka_2]
MDLFLGKTTEGKEKEELQDLQERLNSKIKIISPAIDMIELISARGNTSLESAVSLTKSLRWEIQSLGQRLATAANAEENMKRKGSKGYDKAHHERELKQIVQAIRRLLTRIEDAVPLINLAITASGASLSSTLPTTVSPSRLLQASTFLTAGDSLYGSSSSPYVQIGPTFTLSMYMLFAGHLRPQNEEDVRQSTWKETIHKADVRLMRVPIDTLYLLPGIQDSGVPDVDREGDDGGYFSSQMSAEIKADEYAYQLVIVEDLEDDRVHSFEEDEPQPGPYGEVATAGIREAVPIHELSKIFYADTGKILNIGSADENNSPVLLLKRDPNAVPPRRMMDRFVDDNDEDGEDTNGVAQPIETNGYDNNRKVVASTETARRASSCESRQSPQIMHAPNPWRFSPDLDPEWIAFEVYSEVEDSESETELENSPAQPSRSARQSSIDPEVTSTLSLLSVNTPSASPSSLHPRTPQGQTQVRPTLPPIRTSLSLLETLLRLLSLQQFQQTPHLSIPDELLAFFLSESATTGAAENDAQERKRVREEARRRVGFDPYDESPIKRRGEDYQYRAGDGTPSKWEGMNSDGEGYERYGSPLRYESSSYHDEGYDTYRMPSRSPSMPSSGAPQTPPLLLKSRSRSGTPDSPARGIAPPRRWKDGLREGTAEAVRKGSPLARPGTGLTDEGLGTSPASAGDKAK